METTNAGTRGAGWDDARAYLVGGGVASMEAATFMVSDGDMLGHLHIGTEAADILDACTCIPCTMPFPTSQFMPRERGDRPPVLPEGTRSVAFIGQFVEVPQDVVFTVNYPIRSARVAVHGLPGLQSDVLAVYQGKFNPGVLLKAFPALHDVRA